MKCRLALAGFALTVTLAAQVTYDDIRRGPGVDWLTYAGDYQGRRHSPLTQITRDNAGSLVPKWVYRVEGATHLESSPLVYQGVMYVTNSNELHALDARTGRKIWSYRDERAASQRVNRGAAILGNRVFFVTSDCYLVALDRRTGAVLWSKQYADPKKGYYGSLAPLAVKDRVIVGVAGGDSGMRGFIASYSPSTGEELWRFYTIPSKGEPGAESWGDFAVEWGGGATWLSGTYDPDLNMLYWPTGNPWPDFYGGGRRGDNLYSCSIVALDLSTGKLKWYFQFTPHDTHDWDAQSWPILVDLPIEGRMRKLLLHPNRNGFFYVLDRTTGEFLKATRYLDELTWAKGIDAKGRPIEIPGQNPSPGGTRVCPGTRGGANWMSSSFNPATGLIYVPTVERCDIYYSSAKEPVPMRGFAGGGGERIPNQSGKIFLRALDPKTGERRWQYPMTGQGLSWGGTVSTAGGVVFFADDDGQLVAVDAQSGKHLWNFNMGQLLTASPITYSVDGKQYVSVAAATSVFTFGLFEPVKSMPLLTGSVQ